MKNLSIKMKLITGFLVVIIFTALIGGGGIYGLVTLSSNQSYLYEYPLQNLYRAAQMENSLFWQDSACQRIAGAAGFSQDLELARSELAAWESEFLENFGAYRPHSENGAQLLSSLEAAYYGEYSAYKQQLLQVAQSGDREEAEKLADTITVLTESMTEYTGGLVQANLELARRRDTIDTEYAGWLVIGMSALIVVAIIVAVVLGSRISYHISRPANILVGAANKISRGEVDITFDIENRRDESGRLADAFREMVDNIRRQAEYLNVISQGDYSMRVPVRSTKDITNQAINHMLDSTNRMIREVRTASEMVSTGAQQISQGAQALASGSGEQAASVEQFSASVANVNEKVRENSKHAKKALADVTQVSGLMGQCIDYMNEMVEAMNGISESYQNITKVIKVIDDIAFQTNILSLNAAVEAARAGQHGKGFAVVADEVRNLAAKSAAAARETAALIESSSHRIADGGEIVAKTNQSIQEVNKLAAHSAQSVREISAATEEQAREISDINQGINQISAVVQSNSATSEESAASAQQMSAQAVMLNSIVARFQLREEQEYGMAEESPTAGPQRQGGDVQFPYQEEKAESKAFALTADSESKY